MEYNTIWDEEKNTIFVQIPSEHYVKDAWYAIEGVPDNLKVSSSVNPQEAIRKLSKEVWQKLAELSGEEEYFKKHSKNT